MNVKDFLKSEKMISPMNIAKEMYPNNSDAKTYLSRKLNDKLPFTEKDADKAKTVLNELADRIKAL